MGLLLRGQTNFVRSLWKFASVYNPERQYGDHFREVWYPMRRPERGATQATPAPAELYIHVPTAARREAARASRTP